MGAELAKLPTKHELKEVRKRAIEIRSLLDPEWRHTRARNLRSDGVVRFSRREDPWVSGLAKFVRDYEDCSPSELDDIESKYPDYMWAYTIYTSGYRGPRFHIEAMIIAGMSTDEIADYLNFPYQVIHTYEKCFFDMRRHLDKPIAVKMYITARISSRGLRDLDPDPFWKRIALDEGISLLLAVWGNGILEESDKKKLDSLIASQSRRNALAAMHVRDIQPGNANEVITEYVDLCRVENDRQKIESEAGLSGDPIREILGGLFHAVQFTVAPVRRGSEDSYLELSNTLAGAPAILERLQGTSTDGKSNDN